MARTTHTRLVVLDMGRYFDLDIVESDNGGSGQLGL